MADIDLDALRAARAEQKKTPRSVRLAGKDFPIPEELPWDLVEGLALDDEHLIISGVKQLLGEHWEQFRAVVPTFEDVLTLAVHAAALRGFSPGKSSASGGSSPNTSKRSRRTSNGSMRSTSRKRAGAPNGSP